MAESQRSGPGRARTGLGAFVEQAFASPRQAEEDGMFPVVRQGYERDKVDAHVRELTETAGADRKRAEQAAGELRAAQARIAELEQSGGSGAETGYGSRVERLLNFAEQEAAEVRNSAHQEANSFREQARSDAEAHRHKVEEELMTRASKMDEDASARTAKLNQREQDIEEKLASAKAEADRIRAAAERDADALRAKATQHAQELTEEAERSAQGTREAAQEQADQLARVRDGVRADMAELHRLLGDHLEGSESTDAEPAESSHGQAAEPDVHDNDVAVAASSS